MTGNFKVFLQFNEGLLVADGFDDAIIGTAYVNSNQVVVYSSEQCVKILIDRDNMQEEEAYEYFEFNVEGSYMGEKTPVFVWENNCIL